MAARFTDEQAIHDIRRAEDVIQETHSVGHPASSQLLRDRATEIGISVHAAALAVLSGERPEIRSSEVSVPEQRTARDRLRAVLGASGIRR